MEALIFLIAGIFWIPVEMLRRDLRDRASPTYWHRWGAVVMRNRALQSRNQVIGSYMGAQIFERVRFADCDYRFDHVAPSEERNLISGGELYLEPGLVYRMEPPATSRRP